jgi:hypothetical protein
MPSPAEEMRVVIDVWESRGRYWTMQGHMRASGREKKKKEAKALRPTIILKVPYSATRRRT